MKALKHILTLLLVCALLLPLAPRAAAADAAGGDERFARRKVDFGGGLLAPLHKVPQMACIAIPHIPLEIVPVSPLCTRAPGAKERCTDLPSKQIAYRIGANPARHWLDQQLLICRKARRRINVYLDLDLDLLLRREADLEHF